MKSTMLLILVLALSLMVCPAKVSGQVPLGTAFTYQGFLTENGRIVKDDRYDLQFRLFDADVGGNAVGSDGVSDFEVIDGHIGVELDFGGDAFTGDRRWLQTSIRRSGMNEPFTDLAPRLELTLTPYTLYALSAEDADTVDGLDASNLPYVGGGGTADYIPIFTDANTLSHSVIHQSAGNIGIGTTSPTEKLNVVGNARIDGNLRVTGSQDIVGVVAATDGFAAGGTTHYKDGWIRVYDNAATNNDLRFRVGGAAGGTELGTEIMRLTGDGNLGIGTPNPSERLHVAGSIRIVDGTEGANSVLTSDADGVASWQTPPDSGVPSGVIVMWSGSIGDIPNGWALCDGGIHIAPNGNPVQTPNLTSRFIRSVPNAATNPGAIGGSSTHTHSAGSYSASSHTHSYSGTTGSGGGNHCSDKGGSCSHTATKAHTHTYSGTTGSGGGGSISGTSAAASSLPPYYELAFIMRLPD